MSWVRITPRVVLGLLVMAAGVLITLENLGVDVFGSLFLALLFPGLVAFAGVLRLLYQGSPLARAWGAVLLVVGGWMILYELDYVQWDFWDFWPMLLVLVGFGLVIGALRGQPWTPVVSDDPTVTGFGLMAGHGVKNASPAFRGGSVTAVMGGCDVDLTAARLDERGAVIHAIAFWGGADIKVPEDWVVVSRGLPLLGGFDNSTRPPRDSKGPRLLIEGFALMGGIDITNPPRESEVGE